MGRAPDAAGLSGAGPEWLTVARRRSGESITQAFLNSAEYTPQFTGISNPQFVDALHVDAASAARSGLRIYRDGWAPYLEGCRARCCVGHFRIASAQAHQVAQYRAGLETFNLIRKPAPGRAARPRAASNIPTSDITRATCRQVERPGSQRPQFRRSGWSPPGQLAHGDEAVDLAGKAAPPDRHAGVHETPAIGLTLVMQRIKPAVAI